MAEEREWIEEPAEAAGDARSRDYVNLGLPPPLPSAPARPLHYARPGRARRNTGELPVAAGFFMGIALYVTVAAVWWGLVNSGGGLAVALWGLAGVPATAILIAVVLQATLGWRGIAAGAAAAFGLTFLIGILGIAAICGGPFKIN
jgi:hypothetical protein